MSESIENAADARSGINGDARDHATDRLTPPLVSIIINNFNYGRYVRQAIESAIAQTYGNLELIIVDDGSLDDSRDVIADYEDRATVIYKANGGQASAFNAGISAANGRFALILDSDDYLFPSAIATCVREYRPDYSRVFFRLRYVDECGRAIISDELVPLFNSVDGDLLSSGLVDTLGFWGPQTSGNFFDLGVLKSVIPVPEQEYRICADAYILAKTSTRGPVKSVDEELGAYRVHSENHFFGYSSMYGNPRRLRSQIDNYFLSRMLVDDAYREVNRPQVRAKTKVDFWLLHVLSAALAWNVDGLDRYGVSRTGLLSEIAAHAIRGQGAPLIRFLQSTYLSVLLLSPPALAQALLQQADARKFRGSVEQNRQASMSARKWTAMQRRGGRQ